MAWNQGRANTDGKGGAGGGKNPLSIILGFIVVAALTLGGVNVANFLYDTENPSGNTAAQNANSGSSNSSSNAGSSNNSNSSSASNASNNGGSNGGGNSGSSSSGSGSNGSSSKDDIDRGDPANVKYVEPGSADPSKIPAWSGKASIELNGNKPEFTEAQLNLPYGTENYSPLDSLGRCGAVIAMVGPETLPTEKRGNISSVHPTAWHSSRYAGIDGEALYNRCHLLGHALTAENANENNLVTGTRYLNATAQLPYEEAIGEWVRTTGNHVLVRCTPVFEGDNLLCSGLQFEAYSIEDKGKKFCFNVWCYNVQPGIVIDYATGDNWLDTSSDLVKNGTISAK